MKLTLVGSTPDNYGMKGNIIVMYMYMYVTCTSISVDNQQCTYIRGRYDTHIHVPVNAHVYTIKRVHCIYACVYGMFTYMDITIVRSPTVKAVHLQCLAVSSAS